MSPLLKELKETPFGYATSDKWRRAKNWIETLEGYVAKYGHHTSDCGWKRGHDCDCGFEDVYSQLQRDADPEPKPTTILAIEEPAGVGPIAAAYAGVTYVELAARRAASRFRILSHMQNDPREFAPTMRAIRFFVEELGKAQREIEEITKDARAKTDATQHHTS